MSIGRLHNLYRPAFIIFAITLLFSWRISVADAEDAAKPPYPQGKFAVMSDLHLLDLSLGSGGKAFEESLASDRKLVVEGNEILDSAIDSILKTDVSFVLVTGDMTKDGELASHRLVASKFAKLEAAGKQVYVVPGNHDVNNPLASSFTGDTRQPVANVTPEQFADIYGDFGYKQAVERDPNSLSYVFEPIPGLWVLAMDACRYREYPAQGKGSPITAGRFSPETLLWIDSVLAKAAVTGKAVIGMMHHGVVEHFRGQEKEFTEYLVDDWRAIGKRFAAGGMKVVFTGHYHAQDIVTTVYDGKSLTDIETGSLVTYPDPFRIVELSPVEGLRVSSEKVTAIKSHPSDFQEFSRAYVFTGLDNIAISKLKSYPLPSGSAKQVAAVLSNIAIAHLAGDEPPEGKALNTSSLGLLGRFALWVKREVVNGMANDLFPADNNVIIPR